METGKAPGHRHPRNTLPRTPVSLPTGEPPPSRAEGLHAWRRARLLPDTDTDIDVWVFPSRPAPRKPPSLGSTLLGSPRHTKPSSKATPCLREPPVDPPQAGRISLLVPASHLRAQPSQHHPGSPSVFFETQPALQLPGTSELLCGFLSQNKPPHLS